MLILTLIFILCFCLYVRFYKNNKVEGMFGLFTGADECPLINTSIDLKLKLREVTVKSSQNTKSNEVANAMINGKRMLDFKIISKNNVPYVDSDRLNNVLDSVFSNIGNAPNGSMNGPLFINLRFTGSEDVSFFNAVAKTLKDSGLTLYNKPGYTETPLSEAKETVGGIYNELSNAYQGFTLLNPNDSIKTTMPYNLQNANEYYSIYENDENDEIDEDGQEGWKGFKKLRRRAKKAGRSIKKGAKKAGRPIIKEAKKAGRPIIKGARKARRSIKRRARKVRRSIKKRASKLSRSINKSKRLRLDAFKRYKKLKKEAIARSRGQSRLTRQIGILNTKIIDLEGDIVEKENKNIKLSTANEKMSTDYNTKQEKVKSIGGRISNALTKKITDKNRVTGDTLLGEMYGKIIICVELENKKADVYDSSALKSIENIYISGNRESKDPLEMYRTNDDLRNREVNNALFITNANNYEEVVQAMAEKSAQFILVPEGIGSEQYHNLFNNSKSGYAPIEQMQSYIKTDNVMNRCWKE